MTLGKETKKHLIEGIREEDVDCEWTVDEDGNFVIYQKGSETPLFRGNLFAPQRRKNKGRAIRKKGRGGINVTYKSSNGKIITHALGLNTNQKCALNLEAMQLTDFIWEDAEDDG